MPRTTRTVRVREIPGEPFCFEVESWSKPEQPHRVELVALNGFGQCSCMAWFCNKWPVIRDDVSNHLIRGTKRTECRHVEAARVYKWNQEMKRLAAEQTQLQPVR